MFQSSEQEKSILYKITFVSMLTVFMALIAQIIFIGVYEYYSTHQESRLELHNLCHNIGQASVAALEFNDQRAAETILDGLVINPSIISTILYDRSGKQFANYLRPVQVKKPYPDLLLNLEPSGNLGFTYRDKFLLNIEQITFNNELIGYVAIQKDIGEMINAYYFYLRVSLLILVLSLILGGGFAYFISRKITKPIKKLAQQVEEAALQNNFSTRFTYGSIKEINQLVGNINRLLTQVQQSEKELTSSAVELKHYNEELEHFCFIAAHDLKEPVKVISNISDLIEIHAKRENVSETILKYVARVKLSAVRMVNLIDDFYQLTKIGLDNPEKTECDLKKMMTEVILFLEEKIASKNAKIIVGDLPVILTCPELIRQVFINIIGNALKYSEAEKIIIEIAITRKDGKLVLGIKNSGSFIPVEDRSDIFIAFKRLNSKLGVEGTGVGLAICRKIVKRLGGEIWLESGRDLDCGDWTEFKFTLGDYE